MFPWFVSTVNHVQHRMLDEHKKKTPLCGLPAVELVEISGLLLFTNFYIQYINLLYLLCF